MVKKENKMRKKVKMPRLTKEEELLLLKYENDPAAYKKLMDAIIKHIYRERMWGRARVVK